MTLERVTQALVNCEEAACLPQPIGILLHEMNDTIAHIACNEKAKMPVFLQSCNRSIDLDMLFMSIFAPRIMGYNNIVSVNMILQKINQKMKIGNIRTTIAAAIDAILTFSRFSPTGCLICIGFLYFKANDIIQRKVSKKLYPSC